ncbi:MAG: SMI1/KNR4 family protein [Verrucomicrobiaceae bacterium]|nr:MAG: SMI1/KNR4 family protein [Verrucomicrobiaceae bacterium]
MQSALAASLVSEWHSLPSEVRSAPASEAAIAAFERANGRIPVEYRQFLVQCGGGPVGSEWIDGIGKLCATHAKFKAECGPGGWSNCNVFVIGWDGAGNPISIDPTGAVVVEDHNFGGVHVLASSFIEFLSKGLGHAL